MDEVGERKIEGVEEFENSENVLFINLKYLIIYKYRNLFR